MLVLHDHNDLWSSRVCESTHRFRGLIDHFHGWRFWNWLCWCPAALFLASCSKHSSHSMCEKRMLSALIKSYQMSRQASHLVKYKKNKVFWHLSVFRTKGPRSLCIDRVIANAMQRLLFSWSVDASRILKCKVTISFRKVEAHIRRSKNLFTLQGVNKLSITFLDAVLLQCCSNTSKNIKTAQKVIEKCDHFTISSIKFGKWN